MPDGYPLAAAHGRKPNAFARFRAELAREELSVWSASFAEPETEAAYQRHLVNVEHPKLKAMAAAAIFIWYAFAVLDMLTISEGLGAVLVLRCVIVGPIAIVIALMIRSSRLRAQFGSIAAAAMFIFSLGIVVMIGVIPAPGAPPYIIGVLCIFAYGSFFSRIKFPLAATVYLSIAAIYSALLLFSGKFNRVDVISGHFFFLCIAGMAVVTHYGQELRTRQIWIRNRQRALDAAYIEELLIEATAADQSKLNFISILSHELRTPLHQIIGFSEIVGKELREGAAQETAGFADEIRTSAHALLGQIGKMLRYADATAGRISYDPERLDIRELVETALTQARGAAAAKSVSIDLSGLEPGYAQIDHVHSCYALGHLIDNAVKASAPGGRIEISGAPGERVYRLAIRDFGRGMTQSEIAVAFEPFSQTEHVRTRSFDGLGLGLTLARKIFSDQGAELALHAGKTKGLIASVSFPAPPVQCVKSA